MNNIEESELNFAVKLYDRGYISGPKICCCGNNTFSIQYDSHSKISKCIFRCKNNKCKYRYSIRSNSFYALFPKMKLYVISEIIKKFLEGVNASKCYDYLKNEINASISLVTIKNVYTEIRKVISKYYNILYQSEPLGEKDKQRVFAIDESLFVTDGNNNQIWVIGAVDNITKDFRIDIAFKRNEEVLKTFIVFHIQKGNKLITDGWAGYSFIDEQQGYTREVHIHGASDFGFGVNSTSHIESIWSQLKSVIKNIYYIIPHQNFLLYLREAEWRIKNKSKSLGEKIKEFFDCWSVVYDIPDSDYISDNYLNEIVD